MSTSATLPRILVATDASEHAAEAVIQAVARAQAVGGALCACHVLPSTRVHMLFPQSYAPEVTENAEVEERARSFVAESVAIAMGQPPPPFEIFVEHGTEYAEIVRCAETWRASLVVVGHGRRRGHLGGATGIA